MWILALVGTAAGAVGDLRGWWNAWPFLTNLLSSLVGALFGVPVALIVLQRIAAIETHRYERREVVAVARATVDSLLDEVAGLVLEPELLPELAGRLGLLTDDLIPALSRRRYRVELEIELEKVLSAWREVYVLWPGVLADRGEAARILRRASSQWRFFRDHIEPGLLRHRVSWLPASSGEAIDRLLRAATVHYREFGERDDELARAADRTLSTRSTAPLVSVYGGDDAILTGIAEHVEDVAASVRTIADLLAAVTGLAAVARAEDGGVRGIRT
jgi:hypothetical protein